MGTITERKAHALNLRSNYHTSLGNTLLATWMRDSAKHFEDIARKTEKALDSMCLGVYAEEHVPHEEYTHDWFTLEEEWADNFVCR